MIATNATTISSGTSMLRNLSAMRVMNPLDEYLRGSKCNLRAEA
jgi:hypothetical protein